MATEPKVVRRVNHIVVGAGIILAVICFAMYFRGPTYHEHAFVTHQSELIAIDPRSSYTSLISKPVANFQAQLIYANLTNLVLSHSLDIAINSRNGTLDISLVKLQSTGNLTIVASRSIMTLKNVTTFSRLLSIDGHDFVGITVFNPALAQKVDVFIDSSRTLYVQQPDYGTTFMWLRLGFTLLISLNAYSIYRKKDLFIVVRVFLENNVLQKSYLESRGKKKEGVPFYSLFSLVFCLSMIPILSYYLNLYQGSLEATKPVIDLAIDCVSRLFLGVYALMMILLLVWWLLAQVAFIGHKRYSMRNKDLAKILGTYEKIQQPRAKTDTFLFGLFFALGTICFVAMNQYEYNLPTALLFVLLLYIPFVLVGSRILVVDAKRSTSNYLVIVQYTLIVTCIGTLVISAFPLMIGSSFSLWTAIVDFLLPAGYQFAKFSTSSLYNLISDLYSGFHSNILMLTLGTTLTFWYLRFSCILFVDASDRRLYARECLYDILCITAVFLFGQYLMSSIEVINAASTVRALMLSFISNQVRYVLQKTR